MTQSVMERRAASLRQLSFFICLSAVTAGEIFKLVACINPFMATLKLQSNRPLYGLVIRR